MLQPRSQRRTYATSVHILGLSAHILGLSAQILGLSAQILSSCGSLAACARVLKIKAMQQRDEQAVPTRKQKMLFWLYLRLESFEYRRRLPT
jgi:hypothetical protein